MKLMTLVLLTRSPVVKVRGSKKMVCVWYDGQRPIQSFLGEGITDGNIRMVFKEYKLLVKLVQALGCEGGIYVPKRRMAW